MATAPRVALLERLAAPDSRTVARDRSFGDNDAAVVRSVLHNLRRVLNSREDSAEAQPDLGLPSPQELLQNWPVSRERALTAIRRCIEHYEPRLCEVIVRTVPYAPGDIALGFQIAARLIGPSRTPISLTTAVTSDGRVSLSS